MLVAGLALTVVSWWASHQADLEAWTGETEPRQQIGGLLLPILQRQPDTRDLAAMPHTDLPPFGVNTFFEQEVQEERLIRGFDMLESIGVTIIRQQVPWSDIEIPAKGQSLNHYGQNTWEKYDRIFRMARERNLTVVARLDFPPDWSRQDNRNTFAPPDNFEDYGDFVYEFVKRYRNEVQYIQIWNEPNIYPEWGEKPVEPAGYTELLRVAATRAREANPNIVIVSAALAPTLGTPDGKNMSDLEFLQKMYESGAAPYFDILATQAYGLWTGPGDRRLDPERTNFSRPALMREVMVRNGDAGKPVWATEMGWNALPEDFPKPATHGRVTREQQARYLQQGFERSLNNWPWMGAMFYWHFRMVHSENEDQVHYYFGLADADFRTFSAFDAYREVATSPPVMRYGRRQSSDWTITYAGDWRLVEDPRADLGERHESANGPAVLTFTFDGDGLDLIAPTGPGFAPISVTIDGTPAGAGAIDMAGQRQDRAVIPLARGLASGEHTVRIERAGPGVFSVDAFIVSRSFWSPVILPWLGALALLGGLGVLGWTWRLAR